MTQSFIHNVRTSVPLFQSLIHSLSIRRSIFRSQTSITKPDREEKRKEEMRNHNAGGLGLTVISRTFQKLSSLIPSSILPSSSSAPEFNAAFEDLRKLERTMKRIQAMVKTAEERGVKGQDEKLRIEELKEVAYDAEDVVDDYDFEVLSAEIKAGIHLGGDNPKHKREDKVIVPVSSELAIRINEIREKFNEIISEWEALRWDETGRHGQYDVNKGTQTQSTSLVHEPSIHGRDKDKENIIEMLISDVGNCDGVGSLSVLPILGMGGIGKTTIAQLVYSQLGAWVCVSENFSVEVLTRNIIVSFTNIMCEFTELDVLQKTLAKEVEGKKFLIVLDDVWNEDWSLWHLLRTPLLIGTCFGKIVVTTRNESVARNMQTMCPYVLTNLPFEYCWSLFKQLAFEYQDPDPGLLEIGEKILRKCGGLPLAVKALGSLLRFEGDAESWTEILETETWERDMRNANVLPALRVSYDRLPGNLKQCFVVFALFPKDYVIFEYRIIRLWLSLGLVLPKGRKSLEDIGVNYVTELLQRSMIQLFDGKDRIPPPLVDGKERRFIMHDLINDLAQFVSENTFSRIDSNRLHELSCETRYVSIVSNGPTSIVNLRYLNHLKAPRLVQNLDITQYHDRCKIAMISPELFQMWKHVRVLDLSTSDIDFLPDSIGNLRQLRYLNIKNTNVKKLPEPICGLIQVLELERSSVHELPVGISNLINLQQLKINGDTCIPSGIGRLLNLQALPYFSVKSSTWHCALSELKDLVNLKGELHIDRLKLVTKVKDAEDASLCNKRYLKELRLDWVEQPWYRCEHPDEQSDLNPELDEQLLEVLRPHANIEILEILHYAGSSYPKWLGDTSFSKLVNISLSGSDNISIKSLPTLGQLPSLRYLSIVNMPSIENVGREFCSDNSKIGFRSLRNLQFEDMPNWVNWYGVGNGDFSSLQTLRFGECPELKYIPEPLCSSLSTLDLISCRNLTITAPPTFSLLLDSGR